MSNMNQILANRANASLSTGPKTLEGVAMCKYNATLHGLSGKQIVIKGEDPAVYDALRSSLLDEFKPVGEREAMLVEEMGQGYWRLQRATNIETEITNKFGAIECILDPEARRAFQTITRYRTSIERSWHKASQELDKLQKARKEEEESRNALALQIEMRKRFAARPQSAPPPTPKPNAAPTGSVSQPRHPNEDLPLACRL